LHSALNRQTLCDSPNHRRVFTTILVNSNQSLRHIAPPIRSGLQRRFLIHVPVLCHCLLNYHVTS
jgi:hypothetical protein